MRVKALAPLVGGALTLAVAAPAMAAPPSNNDFADATRLTIGHEFAGVVTDANAELGEPAHGPVGPHHTVWFRYRSPRNAKLTVDTGGSQFDTLLAAYTGRDVAHLHQVASDDDGSPSHDLGSTIRFKAHKGRTYRIAVDSYSPDNEPGTYKLWLSDGGIAGKGVVMSVEPGQTVDSVRAHGLRLSVSARRKVPMAVSLRVSRSVARRLGLHSRVLGSTEGTIDYGQTLTAAVRLKRAAARALDGVDSLQAQVRLELPQSTSPDTVRTTRVSL
jgi:hypothetical protein